MTYFGPDGSHHQDGLVADPKVEFAFWRCSISDRIDRTFAEFRDFYKKHNVPFSAYHFVYQRTPKPGYSTSGRSASAQAEAVHRAVGDPTVPIMLDWEHDGPISAASFDDILAVQNALKKIGYLVKWLYTGRWYWEEMGRPTMSGYGFSLVHSAYGNQQPTGKYKYPERYLELGGDSGRGWTKYGGLESRIWQFGSRILYGDRYMDMNAMRDHSFIHLFKDWTPEPDLPVPPPPLPIPIQGEDMYKFPFAAKLPDGGAWYVGDGYERRWTSRPLADQQLAVGLMNPVTGDRLNSWGEAPVLTLEEMDNRLGKLIS